MSLHSLPNEILDSLPLYIDNIESFINTASTCRRLRDALYRAHPNIILQLAAASAPTFFSPHPYFLIAATAREASDWALQDEARSREFRTAIQWGIDGLYDFCLKHSGLTLDDIRRMHQARFSIINPLADKIDKMAGQQWLDTPGFWDGGVSEPCTIDSDADLAAFQIIIYGELFRRSMDVFLQPESADGSEPDKMPSPFFDIHTRIDYFTYCLSDAVCKDYPGFKRLDTGPYANGRTPDAGEQVAMHHILNCGRWRRMWGSAISRLFSNEEKIVLLEDPDQEYWKNMFERVPDVGESLTIDDIDFRYQKAKLLRDALQSQGLEGMQLVTMPLEKVDKGYVNRVRWIKEKVDRLKKLPAREKMGKHLRSVVSHAPDPSCEIEIPCRDMWP